MPVVPSPGDAALLVALMLSCGMPSSFADGLARPEAALPGEAEDAPRPVKLGERIEAGGIALTVRRIDRQRGLGKFLAAKDGYEFVVLTVLIETTSRDSAPFHWKYFTANDSEKGQHIAKRNPFEEGLQDGILAKGKTVQGQVVFEVKKGTVLAIVTYQPAADGAAYPPLRALLDK